MSRDRIITYLWPEAESERAAHRLTQLIYALRRDLGAEDLVVGTSEIRFNQAVITSDVAEFGAARRAGDLERAISLYGGPVNGKFSIVWASRDHARARTCCWGVVGNPITYRSPDGKLYVAIYAGIGGDWFLLSGNVRSDNPADVRPPAAFMKDIARHTSRVASCGSSPCSRLS